MKIHTLQFPRVSPGLIAAVIAAAVIAGGAAVLVARAQTAPTITNAIQNGSNVAVASAPIGSSVHDLAVVGTTTASTTPTGTVDFNLYANTSCSGVPTTQSAVTLVNGAAQSASTTVPAGGLSYFVHYSGDANNVAANSACQALTATAANVSIATALSTSTVLAGSSVYDTATLAGETSDATGTVAYTAYTNNICTSGAMNAGTKTVANGIVPNSNALLFNTPGTYYWQAVYSGDQNNASATSTCQSEALQVTATSTVVTPPATTTPPTVGKGHGLGQFIHDFIKSRFANGHDNGLHLGQIKNGNNGEDQNNDNDNDD